MNNILTGIQDTGASGILETGIQQQPQLTAAQTVGAPAPLRTIQPSPTVSPETKESSSADLEKELATIKAMGAAPSGGLGKTIGGAAGAGIGTIFGPVGTAVGGATGGAVGSIVDYLIDREAAKEARAVKDAALRKQKNRIAKKQASEAWLSSLAKMKGVALSREQEQMDSRAVAKQMQNNLVAEMLNKIALSTQTNETMKNNFLKSRSL